MPCQFPSGYGAADPVAPSGPPAVPSVPSVPAGGGSTATQSTFGGSDSFSAHGSTALPSVPGVTSASGTGSTNPSISPPVSVSSVPFGGGNHQSGSTAQSGSSSSGAVAPGATSNSSSSSTSSSTGSNSGGTRFVAYWDNYVNFGGVEASQLDGVTHVILSFVELKTWTTAGGIWQYSTAENFDKAMIDATKALKPDIKMLAALGGWGSGEPIAAAANGGETTQAAFAANAAAFVKQYGLDGLDLDWEFPLAAEATNFINLCKAIKSAIGADKLLTVALPSKVDEGSADPAAYTQETFAALEGTVDMWNVMTYDYMNRYDTITKHQSGGGVVKKSMEYYIGQGIDPQKCNIGFMNDAKYFTLTGGCTAAQPIGCTTPGREYYEPAGKDNGQSGWLRYNPLVDVTLGTDLQDVTAIARASFNTRPTDGSTAYPDELAQAWYDEASMLFWTWTSPEDNAAICAEWKSQVGGMMVWTMNQDENGPAGGPHMQALASCVTGG